MVGAAVRIGDNVLGVLKVAMQVARKDHVCIHCRRPIVPGERYRRTIYHLTTGVVSEPEHASYAACMRAKMPAEAVVSSQDEQMAFGEGFG